MNTLLACAVLVAAHVQAQRYDLPRRLDARAVAFGNDTSSYTNSSSTSLTSSTSQGTQPQPPLVTDTDSSTTPPIKPPTTGQSPPIVPSGGQGGPANGSPGGGDGLCAAGILTYFGSVYPTVYVTVTEGYDVTLSAANATMTDSEILITPSSHCSSTVVPVDNPDQPMATIEATIDVPISESPGPDDGARTIQTTDATNVTQGFGGGGGPGRAGTMTGKASGLPKPPFHPNVPDPDPDAPASVAPSPEAPPPGQTHVDYSPTVVQSTIYNSAPYTSTVVVTKKTPVPVVPRTEEPPPVFQPRPPSPNAPNPPNQQTGGRPSPGGARPGGPNSGGAINTLIQLPPSQPAGGSGLVESVIRSLFFPSAPTPAAAPQTTLNNVPVAVRPSAVVIGSSEVPIPTGRDEAVVTEGGAVFTVRAQEIVAPSTTVAFGPLNPQGAISVAPTRVTAAPGVIVEVAGSTAIVDGTTFRLDESFSTVITISGERISIGPSGIGLPSTTIAAGRITDAPRTVQTVGDVTLTIDGSSVIIAGTTYGIASDSPTVTTEVNGERISIGPGGVGFDSTTVRPTTERTSTREAAAEATSSEGGSTGGNGDSDGDDSDNTASAFLMSPFAMVVSLFALFIAL